MAPNLIQLVVVCLLIPNITNADTACKPKLERRSTDPLTTGQNVKLLCGVTECMPVSKVIYEKTDVVSPVKWTSVYEGVDNTNHRPLDTGTNYDVTGRVMFTALTSTFILEILSVTVKDNFKWRCIVIDHNNVMHVSNSVQLTVVPEQNVTIKPTRPKLVAGRGKVFTCEIGKIYPKPKLIWKVDGNHHTMRTEETTVITPYNDGLMLVRGRIYIQFSKPGRTVLICILQTNTGEPWLEHEITVDVKSPAKIIHPEEDINVNAEVGSPIAINCSASGYRPTITWQRNGFEIRKGDPHHIMTEDYNISWSTSTLALSPISLPLSCEKIDEYNSVYTCTAVLEQPYESMQVSKFINVKVLHPPQIRWIPQTVITDEFSTVTLWCEICSNLDFTSEWSYDGQSLQGENVEFLKDGSVRISGNPRSGGYYRTVSNSIGSVDCVVYLDNTSRVNEDSLLQKIILLGILIIIIEIIIRRPVQRYIRRSKSSGTEQTLRDEEIPLLYQDSAIQDSSTVSLKTAKLVTTFEMKDLMRCAWSAKRTECVFMGGWDSSSITVIDTSYQPIKHTLTTGDYIKYGLAIGDKYHLVNAFYIKKKIHLIQCVHIDTNCMKTSNIEPTFTLDLHSAAIPRCLFNLDINHVGIYCVDASSLAVVFSFQVPDIMEQLDPSDVNRIKLENHHASLSDQLCVNGNGEVCVVSYFDGKVYIYKQSGALHKTISRPGFDKMSFPRNVLGLSDNSLVFVTIDRVHRYDGVKREVIKLNNGAVFTNSLLWCCDSDKKIHVYNRPVISNCSLTV